MGLAARLARLLPREQRPVGPSETNPLGDCTVQHNVVYRASTHLGLHLEAG